MDVRSAGLLAAVSLAACSAGGGGAAEPAAPAAPAPIEAPVRLFHAFADQDFYVGHGALGDRVIAAGARLAVAPGGAVTAAAWDLDFARRNDALVGGMEVPARLGGGFLHWTRAALFRSATFTGPLTPVAVDPDVAVRGARAGLSAVVVFTDAGPRALDPGASQLRPLPEPGVRDMAAISDRRAARLDLFGHLSATDDGGRTWIDLSPEVGLTARDLAASPGDLFYDTWEKRVRIRPGGVVDPTEIAGRPGHDPVRRYQIAWPGFGVEARSELTWIGGNTTPLGAAVAAGGDLGDGTAYGFLQGVAVRVDLRTGALLRVSSDWVGSSLPCQPVRAPDALLFACTWERFQGYGGAILRVEGDRPPVLERAFSDDGAWATDDEGAIGYLGSCRAEPRFFDPEEQVKLMESGVEPPLSPVFCVRRGPSDWVERRVDLPEGAMLSAWIPARDGRAAAIAVTGDPLPPPASPAGRAFDRGGVHLVIVDRDIQGWAVPRPSAVGERAGVLATVDRRFRLRDDDTIDGWLTPSTEAYPPVAVGATFDPRGHVTVHAAAPGMIAAAFGGAHGLALGRDGDLFETRDHGRTFRRAGPSPVPPAAFNMASCSALGCTIGSVVRVGWGGGPVTPRVDEARPASPAAASRARRLACKPAGDPTPISPPARPEGSSQEIAAPWGEALEVIRDASVPAPPEDPDAAPQVAPVAEPAPSAAPAAKKPRPRAAVLRTHTLLARPLFARGAATRRLEATDAAAAFARPSAVTPILGPDGEAQILIQGEHADVLIAGDRVTVLPSPDARHALRRDSNGPAGLSLGGRVLVIADDRRRMVLDARGPGAPSVPIAVGVELSEPHRSIALARRDDGAAGLLVIDGAAAATAGVALLDRAAFTAGPVTALAPWSAAVTAADPSCGHDPTAFRALITVDPSAWLTLDPQGVPGLSLGKQGIMEVRWGRDRVCVEALDAALINAGARPDRSLRLVARWAGKGDRGAALWAPDLRQDLVCRIE